MSKIHESATIIVAAQGAGDPAEKSKEPTDDVDFRDEFRILLRLMAIFGLYHTPKQWKKTFSGRGIVLNGVHQMYCLVIMMILMAHGVHMMTSVFLDGVNHMALKIMIAAYWCECAMNVGIWFILCRTDKLPDIFDKWKSRSSQIREFGSLVNVPYLRKKMILCCAGVIAFVVFNTVFIASVRLLPFENLRNDTAVFMALLPEGNWGWEFVHLASFIFANAAFCLPITFIVTLTSTLCHQFEKLTKKFTDVLTDEGGFKGCLKSFRRQHQHLSKMVFLVDDAFNFYLAVTIGCSVILACFGLYQLVVAQDMENVLSILLVAFWVKLVSSKFGVLGWFTANLHEEAHDIVNYIHDIGDLDYEKHEDVAQMNMFLARLTGPAIALTLWDILPLTKDFILTVVGVFITYFALVAQSF